MGEERIEGQEGQKAPETAPEAGVSEHREDPAITLDESGDLNIPDSFWDETAPGEPARGEETGEDGRPAHYTPEEFAEAYRSGRIDESRIDPAIADYYRAAAAVERQRRDAEALRKQAMERTPPPPEQPGLSWDQVMEAGKLLAARYLGIKPDEFDEFDERHKAARLTAVNEIRERARGIAVRERQAEEARAARIAGISNIYAEYRQRVPELDEIGEKFFPEWRQNLTVRESEIVRTVMERGGEGQIRALFDKVIADYRAANAPKRKTAPPPPDVMRASGGEETERAGMADVSKLGGMSPEEQAEWLIKNKFIA